MISLKKVAILTINDDRNYGNRLQNYAVQEILSKYNCKVETINNQKDSVGMKIVKKKIKYFIKLLLPLKKCKRYNNFMRFNKKIKFSKKNIDENNIPKGLGKEYDVFFTGSDQVWNPTFGRMSDIDFLCFTNQTKRNSISASFGVSEIPDNLKEYYSKRLKEMNNISVREDRGKKIIEELTGRKDVEVLVDPTMMLSKEEWDMVSKKPKQIEKIRNKKYILNYFLGKLSETRKNEIARIAKENDCEIINILNQKDPFYVSGPSEFLWLEKNAFLICTDSFHSCVFALIYNKPFIVFNREDNKEKMNSRIDTLIKKFELENRRYNGINITEDNLKHNYNKAYKILELEIKKANEFLTKSLSIVD